MPRSTVLEATGLSKAYGPTTAVDAIGFRVPPGRIVGLVGNNGAGKTTTLKMVCGLLEPTDGRVRVSGGDPLNPAVRAHIGFLPEDSPLYEDLRPLDLLAYFGALYGLKRSEARRTGHGLLRRLRLDEAFLERRIGQLSKGSARKVALARALLHDPGLVVLDEAASGLDPATQDVLDRFLLELRDSGKAVLLSAHHLEQVERVCDEVLVMHGGRIVRRGPLHELQARATPRYRVRSTLPFPGSSPDGPHHEAHATGWAAAKELASAAAGAGGRVLAVELESLRLADVLREATGESPGPDAET